jgi:hypothetical protein
VQAGGQRTSDHRAREDGSPEAVLDFHDGDGDDRDEREGEADEDERPDLDVVDADADAPRGDGAGDAERDKLERGSQGREVKDVLKSSMNAGPRQKRWKERRDGSHVTHLRDVGAVQYESLPPAVDEEAADPGGRKTALLPEIVGQDRILDKLLDEREGGEEDDGDDEKGNDVARPPAGRLARGQDERQQDQARGRDTRSDEVERLLAPAESMTSGWSAWRGVTSSRSRLDALVRGRLRVRQDKVGRDGSCCAWMVRIQPSARDRTSR